MGNDILYSVSLSQKGCTALIQLPAVLKCLRFEKRFSLIRDQSNFNTHIYCDILEKNRKLPQGKMTQESKQDSCL